MSDLNVYTTAEINALTPITGDLVVDSTLNAVKLYDGAAWKTFNSSIAFENRWGADFDGAGSQLNAAVNYTHASINSYTVSCWVYVKSFSNGAAVYQMTGGSGWMDWSNNNFLRINSGTSAMWYHSSDTGYTSATYPNLNISTNTWYHFAQVWDGTSIKVYLDGTLSNTLSNGHTTSFGGRSGYNLDFLMGGGRLTMSYPCKLDDFAFWDSDKSSSISDIYNSGVPGNIATLSPKNWYRMGDDSNDSASDGGSIATTTDSGGNGTPATQATASNQPTFSDLTGESIYV